MALLFSPMALPLHANNQGVPKELMLMIIAQAITGAFRCAFCIQLLSAPVELPRVNDDLNVHS